MDEDALKEKLRKKKEAEELEEEEKKRIRSEKIKERKGIETDIKNEVAKWKEYLPKSLEIIDEKAFNNVSSYSYYLKKGRDSNEICVLIKDERNIEEELSVADFMETMVASNDMLLKLRERIPGFISYIGNKIT